MSLLSLNKKVIAKLCICLLFTCTLLGAKEDKNCNYKTFTIHVNEDVSIGELINEIGNMCHFSIITKDTQAKKILAQKLSGINIQTMSLYEIFELILSENDLNYTYTNNILRLSTLLTKTFQIDYITSVRKGTASLSASVEVEPITKNEINTPLKTTENEIRVTEEFDFWDTLGAQIQAILNNKTGEYIAPNPIINQNTGLITITGTKAQITRVAKYINNLKKRLHKQVMIDVSIISVKLNNEYTRGVNWDKFKLSLRSNANANSYSTLASSAKNISIINSLNFSMEGLINFIEQQGRTKILSNPKVMTLNNQQSLITIGDNINYRILQETKQDKETKETKITYTPRSIFIGVLLNLLPEVSDDNKIMLRINPSLSSFKYPKDDQKQDQIREIAPDTLEKKLSTVVQVNSGDTIILGGLIGQTKGKEHTSVPILGDLPVLGAAFNSTYNSVVTTELVFVITPHVIDSKKRQPIATSLKDLGFSESMYE